MNKKQQNFSLFQVHSIDPYGILSSLKVVQKGYGTFVTLMKRVVDVEKRAWARPFCCNNEDYFWSKS